MTETIIPSPVDDEIDRLAQQYETVAALSQKIKTGLKDASQSFDGARAAFEKEDYCVAYEICDSAWQTLLQSEKDYTEVEALELDSRHARDVRVRVLPLKTDILKLLDETAGLLYQSAQLCERFSLARDAEKKGNWNILLQLVESALEIHPGSVIFSELRKKYQGKQILQPETRSKTIKSWINGNLPWLFVFAGFACCAILLAGWLVVSTK